MISVTVGPYLLNLEPGSLPERYGYYVKQASLVEEFNLVSSEGTFCCVCVSHYSTGPLLVVAQRYAPDKGGFDPGILLIPETKTLFIGAGERLLAYRLDPLMRLWEDQADMGFWHWSQHNQYILMAAELELAAWDASGKKLWTTFVEPPWSYQVLGDQVLLDVMGKKSTFGIMKGPAEKVS